MAVRAVLVDADGVLQVNAEDWMDVLRGFVPAEASQAFVDDVFAAEQPALRGECSFREVVVEVCRRWDLRDREQDLVQHWRHAVVQAPTVAVVRDVRAAGTPCHLATNQNDVRAAYLLDDLGYGELFDGAFCSCELGATKDDPRFFRTVAERLGVPLGDLLLVDDGEDYVDCARSLGMGAVRWCVDDGVDELRRLLAAAGVPLTGQPGSPAADRRGVRPRGPN